MSREEILDVVTQWQQAMSTRNLDALAELYAEDAETESPLGGSAKGREAVITVLEAFHDAFPSATWEFGPLLIDGNRVVGEVIISGTQQGPLLGLPPSGRPFRFDAVVISDLADGKIVHERRIYDFTGLLIQLGVLKAKPA